METKISTIFNKERRISPHAFWSGPTRTWIKRIDPGFIDFDTWDSDITVGYYWKSLAYLLLRTLEGESEVVKRTALRELCGVVQPDWINLDSSLLAAMAEVYRRAGPRAVHRTARGVARVDGREEDAAGATPRGVLSCTCEVSCIEYGSCRYSVPTSNTLLLESNHISREDDLCGEIEDAIRGEDDYDSAYGAYDYEDFEASETDDRTEVLSNIHYIDTARVEHTWVGESFLPHELAELIEEIECELESE